MTREEFADLVASLQPSPHESNQKLHAEVLSIDITGNTAVAKVRDEYLGMMFIDTLSFIKVEGLGLSILSYFTLKEVQPRPNRPSHKV